MPNPLTGNTLQKAMKISISGMQAQAQRMLIISQNIANAGSRPSQPGQTPYQRQTISFKSQLDKKNNVRLVKVDKIMKDTSAFKTVYDPTHPAADKNGMVLESNADLMIEMADARETRLSHEANLRTFEKALSLLQDKISLLK